MKLSLPPKFVENLVWVPIIWFCKIFIPSYGFDALLCRNWRFSPLLPDFTDNSIVCNKSVALLVQFFSTLKQKQLTPNLCELKPTLHAAKGLGPHSEDHQEIWRKKKFKHPFFFLLPSLVEPCIESWWIFSENSFNLWQNFDSFYNGGKFHTKKCIPIYVFEVKTFSKLLM
jgi:hypothetical protein